MPNKLAHIENSSAPLRDPACHGQKAQNWCEPQVWAPLSTYRTDRVPSPPTALYSSPRTWQSSSLHIFCGNAEGYLQKQAGNDSANSESLRGGRGNWDC